MLKNLLFFAGVVIALVVFFGRPKGSPVNAVTVAVPRAALYADLNRYFVNVEAAAAKRAARQNPGMAPVTIHVSREEGRTLDLQVESQNRKAEVKVSLEDTEAPNATGLQVTVAPSWPMTKATKLKPVERVEWVLSVMAIELGESPEVSLLRDHAPFGFEG